MFPTAALTTLLSFARGQTPWGKPVFDAAIEVAVYFGQIFVPADYAVAGATAGATYDDELAAVDALIAGTEDEGHPIATVSPLVVALVLKFALGILLKRLG